MFISTHGTRRLLLCVAGIASFCCSMTIGRLTASPQRPYIHEFFGAAFLISWPEGQRLHEEAMELYYAGDFTATIQKLDKAVADAEQLSKAKTNDIAILLTTSAEVYLACGDMEKAVRGPVQVQ